MAGFVCHDLEVTAIDANLCQGGLQPQLVKEEVLGLLYTFPSYLHSRQGGINTEYVHAIFPEAIHRGIIQYIFHPAWSKDGQAKAMGNIIYS